MASAYDQDEPFTPAWAERVTGVPREHIIHVAREFAGNAEKTNGRSMVILGAGVNHWYHMDMTYRGIINLLVLCGCVGQSGGGWSHYVGQEKLRPQTGWLPIAFGLDWSRPPRQMNATSFFYAHTDQWRYETLKVSEILVADGAGRRLVRIDDRLQRPRRAHGLAAVCSAAPAEPAHHRRARRRQPGLEPKDYVAQALRSGTLELSCHDPDDPANWPRNMFVWRSNLLGSSGKGHEYFLKHLLGTSNGVLGKDLGVEGREKPQDVALARQGAGGKARPAGDARLPHVHHLRLLRHRAADRDLVREERPQHLRHAPVHPSADRGGGSGLGIAHRLGHLQGHRRGVLRDLRPRCSAARRDVVLTPMLHDTPGELAQPYGVEDWKRDGSDPVPGKTMPAVTVVERDYPNLYARFTSHRAAAGRSSATAARASAGTPSTRSNSCAALNGTVRAGAAAGQPQARNRHRRHRGDPEPGAGNQRRGRGEGLGGAGQHDRPRPRPSRRGRRRTRRSASATCSAQPRKIISSPTWSGIESEQVCYNAGYTNVHELIPWRTLTGRQQFYQDHLWMRAFGEALGDLAAADRHQGDRAGQGKHGNGNPEIVLNFITPHQKWGIHSTYTDNLLMLTLNRGGPCIWISETDAQTAGIVDNDWVEAFNANGALIARAVVSQRVNPGMVLMYHAQEKIVNMPGSEITGKRGGIHNSVTRTVLKPTHMIGGYAQQSYGFNYYGTVGTNRDEFVVVRRWTRSTGSTAPRPTAGQAEGDRAMKIRAQIAHGAEPRQVHRLPHLLGHLQERLDQPRRRRIRLVQQRRDQARHRLSRRSGRTRSAGTAAGCARPTARIEPRIGGKWRVLAKIFANPDLPQIDDYYEPFTFDYAHLQTAPESKATPTARPRSLITGERMEKIEWGPNWEEILGGEFAKRSQGRQLRSRPEGDLRRSSRTPS